MIDLTRERAWLARLYGLRKRAYETGAFEDYRALMYAIRAVSKDISEMEKINRKWLDD